MFQKASPTLETIENIFSVSPRAIRDDKHIQETFASKAKKAYEQYKIDLEIRETRRMKTAVVGEKAFEEVSDGLGMYIIDTQKNRKLNKPIPESISAHSPLKDNFMVELVKFFKNMYVDMKFELTWKQFMCITFSLQVPIWYLLRHIDMMYKWGALSVLLAFVVIGGFIAMPVYMILMFLGNYSGRSYICFWECVPILKGVAYSVALMCIIQEILNLSFASLSLDYLFDIISSNQYPWKDCNYRGSSPGCYSTPTNGYNESCCIKNTENCSNAQWAKTVFKFAAYDYYMSHQMEISFRRSNKSRGMPLTLLVFVTFIWVMMFLMMVIGLKRFRSVITTISIVIFAIIFIPMMLLTLFYSDRNMFAELESHYGKSFNIVFWLEVATHSLHKELAGDIITYGAISTPGISTAVDTICIYTLKFLFLILLTVWVSIGVTMLKTYYNVINDQCIAFSGMTVIYAIFPDLISRLPLAKMFLITYFVIIFFWCFSTSIYTLSSLIISVMEQFPKLMKIRAIFCGVFCIIACALNLLSMQQNLEYFYMYWFSNTYLLMKVSLLFFTMIGMHIYTLGRLSNDYHFTYGQKLSVFWLHGVKVAMLLITVLIIVKAGFNFSRSDLHISDTILCIIILPTAIGALIVFIRYKSGLRKTLINPDPLWGPPNYKKKVERSKFDPKRALRYRTSTQTCKHNCLLNSGLLISEIKYWERKCLLQHND